MIRESSFSGRRCGRVLVLLAVLMIAPTVFSAPVVPESDDVIVETLPAMAAWRREERELKRQLAGSPYDAATAVSLAGRYLDQARALGDARYAGLAMGVLRGWQHPARDPLPVLVLQATLAQYVHDFDRSEQLLGAVIAREPRHAQAWLTLATVRRVRGRLELSDQACAGVGRAGQPLYAAACTAENRALRGQRARALQDLEGLLALPASEPLRPWLLTSIAAVHELGGDYPAADRAYRAALSLNEDPYALLARSDLLLALGRPAEARLLLRGIPLSDAVLLRLAIAARALGDPNSAQLAQELAERFRAAAERPGGAGLHLRERARFALELQGNAGLALTLARRNLDAQREPADWLLFGQAAQALGDAAALSELAQLMQDMGVRDERLLALQ